MEFRREAFQRKFHATAAPKDTIRKRRKGGRPKQSKMSHVHLKFNDEMLLDDLSPEQIAGRGNLEGKATPSVPSIYRHVKGNPGLGKHLRHNNKKYRGCSPAKDGRGSIRNQRSVDDRPAFEPYREFPHTVTSDNGKEFAEHLRMAKELEVDYFFAHPYRSWERGANENMNGLIRQYLPKGTSFENLTRAEVKRIEWKLNNRPRKRLGCLTPLEYISGQIKQIYLTT